MDEPRLNFFGLEAMKKLYESQFKRKEDVVVITIHWLLSIHGFRCIGVGDGREVAGDETQSELLPDDWNNDTTNSLRYIYHKRLYILKVTKGSDDVVINFIKADDMKISSFVIIGSSITEDGLKEEKECIDKMENELVFSYLEKSVQSKTEKLRTDNRPDYRPPNAVGGRGRPSPYSIWGEVGRRDLDPFGSGTGMLLGRNDLNNLVRPPYRFDPVFPHVGPGGGRPPYGEDPDNDMFLPPRFM